MELTPEQIAAMRLALTRAGQAPDADIPTALTAVVDEAIAGRAHAAEIERLTPFEARVAELAPLADEGKAYRADLIEQAITDGKRAMGEAFAEETYRTLLDKVDLATVKRMRDDWRAIGDKQFPGGRLTQDSAADSDPTPISGRRRRVDASARG